jgi:alkanesulfonate monooxygenase SsuD/methylene tetrahydromethanopterin reductase-like flavin-dependent oxidoreductase (luciferase family)
VRERADEGVRVLQQLWNADLPPREMGDEHQGRYARRHFQFQPRRTLLDEEETTLTDDG